MGVITAPGEHVTMEGEEHLYAVSFDGNLRSGEVLNGTVGAGTLTVEELATSDLTITNRNVNTAALTIKDPLTGVEQTVAEGKAVQFFLTGQLLATGRYTILITCKTDSTPARTIKGKINIRVASD